MNRKLDLALCRSLLFVPAHVPRFVDKAMHCGADAVVLDLEDSVPAAQKAQARTTLAASVKRLDQAGVPALVRVNRDPAHARADVDAALAAGAAALVLPKIDIGAQIDELASASAGAAPLVVQVESALALAHLDEIATTQGVVGMGLGADDFCTSIGATPSQDSLLLPTQMVLHAARRAGIAPLGFAGSIAEYRDLAAFRLLVRQASGLGCRGAFCIHPDQIPVLREEFAPSARELDEARAVLAAYDAGVAQGRGAVALHGRMIDAPVAARARALLGLAVEFRA